MGRQPQLQRQDSSFHFQRNHPGCLWAIIHILDCHRWHNVKNMLPHKRNGRLRPPKGNGTSETGLKDHDTAQVPQYFNKEAQILLVERRTKGIVGPNKKLRKSVVTAKETMGKGKTAPTEPPRPKFAKNSSKFKDDKTAKKSEQNFWKEFQTEKGTSENRELRQVNQIDKDISDCLMKEPVDILEMFKLNKKLFVEMLRGEEFSRSKLFRSRNSNTKVGLTKSMSFPAVDPSGISFLRPSKLEHKQTESFPKGKDIRQATPALRSTQNLQEKSSPEKSEGCPLDLKQQGWNQQVVNRFNAIKQKVKQAFKDRRKGHSRLSVKEIPVSSDHLLMAEDGMIDIKRVDDTVGKESVDVDGAVSSIKQASFPVETLERYKHLFAKSFSDNTKYRHCRSLTLASGNKLLKNRLASRSFNRNLSSPDLELFCSFFHDASLDSSRNDKPVTNAEADQNSATATVIMDECRALEISDAELANTTLEELDPAEEFAPVASEIRMDEEDELVEDLLPDCKSNDEMEFSHSDQVLDDETCRPDHLTSFPAELPISEDRIFNKQVKGAESNGIENAYYNHVRDIFEDSGLIESELAGTRRPVASELGKEIGTELDQQLVFDLVNEALLDINGTSSTYLHTPFSFNYHILPPPSGSRLLEAVWRRIGRHLGSWQLGQSLEDVVARDLANGDDGWMSLQLEAEFLALDVEDLIIDQLLGEFICS